MPYFNIPKIAFPIAPLAFCFLAASVQAQETAPAPISPVEAAKIAAPTRITLEFADTPISTVFESLMTQAKLPFVARDNGMGRETMTINVKNLPFWEAVAAFQKASGRDLFRGSSGRNDEPRYSLVYARRTLGGLKWESGALTAFVTGTARTQTTTKRLNFGETKANEPKEDDKDELRLILSVLLDPAVPLVAGSPTLGVIEAVDENGQEVFAPSDANSRGGDWKLDSSLVGEAKTGLGRKIARLKVRYSAFVALEPQTLTWDDLNAPAPKIGPRGDGVENYEIAEAKSTPSGYSVTLRANRPTDGMDFRFAGDAFFGNVKIVDANGKERKGNAGTTADRAGVSNTSKVRKYEARLSFGRPGDTFSAPLKLIWTIPTRFAPLSAEMEWKDVPLP